MTMTVRESDPNLKALALLFHKRLTFGHRNYADCADDSELGIQLPAMQHAHLHL